MKLVIKFNVLILILFQVYTLVNSQVPTSGCDAISKEGTCYSYFTHQGAYWTTASSLCQTWGGHLAKVNSVEENSLMFNTHTAGDTCWIGLNDRANRVTFFWADGSASTFTYWSPGQPDDVGVEDCVSTWVDEHWRDYYCYHRFTCYFCSTTVTPFGKKTSANTYIALEENSFLNRNTTLYCITENKNTPLVTWTFKDLNGVTTSLSATTDATTGVSTFDVTNDKTGYYNCEVSQNGGNTRTYTVAMLDSDFILGAPAVTLNYGCNTTFSLLPPAVNRADIPILTQNVKLSANLVGRWQIPDGSYVNSDSITIPTFYVSNAGLYKYYVINWVGDRILAIQIEISPVGNSFGEKINSNTFLPLPKDSILISNTNLYCISVIGNTPEVVWGYEDVSGNSDVLSGTTDTSTGISTLSATTDVPGYYSCNVPLEGAVQMKYTVEMMDVSQYTVAVSANSYQYTMGVDTDNIFLFCQGPDNSVELSDIHWRRLDRTGFFPNPLDIHRLGYRFTHTKMECFNAKSDNTIMNIQLNVQGPPTITLYLEHNTTFSLLPPAVNRADIPILTQNLTLSANLVGRWQTPVGRYVNSDSMTIPTLYVSHAGLYKFYVTNWNEDWELAIQIEITPVGNSFGQKIDTDTFIPLSKDSVLISNTILYCLNVNRNTPEVLWSYEDVSGNSDALYVSTDTSTGISTLSVTTDVPGYYSCEVSLEGGMKRTYTAEMLDVSQYTVAVNTASYQYTAGIDIESAFLFCRDVSQPTKLSDIHWKRHDSVGFFTNPLDIHRLAYLLKNTKTHPMECFDTESDNTIITVQLNVQGPPVVTLQNNSYTTFSLLPPAVNRADLSILTQNVLLSVNLVGRWQIPDGSYVNNDSITIPTLYVSHAGLYKYYVTNWDGNWELAIQIYISLVESYATKTITDLRVETSSSSSMLVSWSLSESDSFDSEGTFSIYLGFGDLDTLAGTTKELFFEISGLLQNFNYTVRIELQYPYSSHIISATTHHLIPLSGATNPTDAASFPIDTQPITSSTTYTFMALVVILVTILLVVLLICVFIVCAMKRRRRSKVNPRNHQIKMPTLHACEIYKQDNAIDSMAQSNRAYLYKENVEATQPNEIELDLKAPISLDCDSISNP